jgi:hypothetical protein
MSITISIIILFKRITNMRRGEGLLINASAGNSI